MTLRVENIYFFARKGSNGGTSQMYRQFRMKIGLAWSVQNEPVRPAFMLAGSQSDNLITSCSGIGANYIFINTSKGNNYLVKTNFSGNPLNWTQHVECNRFFGNYGNIRGLAWAEYDITNHTGIIIIEYIKNNQVWLATTDESGNQLRNMMMFDPNVKNSEYNQEMRYLNGDTGTFIDGVNFKFGVGESNSGGGIGWDYINNCLYIALGIWGHWSSYTGKTDSSGNKTTWVSGYDAGRFMFYGLYENITIGTLRGSSSSNDANANGFYNFLAKSYAFSPTNLIQGRWWIEYGNHAITYDTLTGVLYVCKSNYAQSDAWIAYSFRKDWPMDKYRALADGSKMNLYDFFNWKNDEMIASPDTCPWAKKFNNVSIIDTGSAFGLYFLSESQKYGSGWCAVSPVKVSGSEYGVAANSWKANVESANDQCCSRVGNYSRYFSMSNETIYEITLGSRIDGNGIDRNDKKQATAIGKSQLSKVANEYSDYSFRNIWGYNPLTGDEFFGFDRNDKTQGMYNDEDASGVVIMYQASTGKCIRFTGIDIAGRHISSRGYYNDNYVCIPNTFVDCVKSSGVAFISDWYWHEEGDAGWGFTTKCLTLTTTNITTQNINGHNTADSNTYKYDTVFDRNRSYQYSVGYSSHYGGYYYATASFSSGIIYLSSSYNGGSDYSFEEFFFQGKKNLIQFFTNTSTGLLAFVQAFPMFIGGYYSTIASSEIKLADNCYNYIYVVRDPDNHDQSYFESYTQKMNVEGASEFSRVYLGYIRTQNGNPVEQSLEYVNNDYKLGKLIASKA